MQDVLAAGAPSFTSNIMPYLLSVGVAPSLGVPLTFATAPAQNLPPSAPITPAVVTPALLSPFLNLAPTAPAPQPQSFSIPVRLLGLRLVCVTASLHHSGPSAIVASSAAAAALSVLKVACPSCQLLRTAALLTHLQPQGPTRAGRPQ